MRLRRLAALLAGATLVISAAACGNNDEGTPPSEPGTPDDVTAEVIPIVDVAPIYLGVDKGFFTDENINLTLDTAAGGANIIPGVAAGQFQFGFSNVVSVLIAQTRGVELSVVAPGNGNSGVAGNDFSGLVVKDPAYASPKDLEGKTVAANTTNGIVELAIRELVNADGGDGSSVNVVAIGFPDMIAALDAGQVDGIFVVEPFTSAAKAKGWTVIGDLAELDPNMTVAVYFTSSELAQSNPDLVERFTRAMTKSLDYAQAHQDEARDIVGTYTKIGDDVRAGMVLTSWSSDISEESLNYFADLIEQYGWAPTRPDVSAMLP